MRSRVLWRLTQLVQTGIVVVHNRKITVDSRCKLVLQVMVHSTGSMNLPILAQMLGLTALEDLGVLYDGGSTIDSIAHAEGYSWTLRVALTFVAPSLVAKKVSCGFCSAGRT
mmetsp:Transcript_17591/g.36521  ORF Transcript_17591/g.36521 Transcript_17591/m.36521 type:complete len:112 (-) Transcript_17591:153-488(-)